MGLLASMTGALGCTAVPPDLDEPWGLAERRNVLLRPAELPARAPAQGDFSAPVPLGLDRRLVAIVARDNLRIGAGARLLIPRGSSDRTEHAIAVAMGSVVVGARAEVGPLYSLGSEPALLEAGAVVHGYVKSVGPLRSEPDARVSFGSIERAYADVEDFSWSVRFPDSKRSILRREGDRDRLDLLPGAYATIELEAGACLRMFSGHYYVDSLRVRDGAVLHVDNTGGPVYVWVRRQLELAGNLSEYYLQPNVLIGFAGTEPPVLSHGLRATLVAPAAKVTLPATRQPHRGAVHAKDVELEPNASFELSPFGAWVRSTSTKENCETGVAIARDKERDCCNRFRRFATLSFEQSGLCLAACSSERPGSTACSSRCRELLPEDLRGAKNSLDECMREVWFSYFDTLQRADLRPNACADLGHLTYREGTCRL